MQGCRPRSKRERALGEFAWLACMDRCGPARESRCGAPLYAVSREASPFAREFVGRPRKSNETRSARYYFGREDQDRPHAAGLQALGQR
jgi:hypothetical protein